MNRLKCHWGLLAVIVSIAFIYSLLPLASALQFGGDEGYESMVGFLMSKGYHLYKQIWCDQPPLRMVLLSEAFKFWGPNIFVARLISAAFGLLLFGTFFELVRRTLPQRTAFIATFFLLASPIVLELSVSVMPEVPAFSLALVSALLMFQWRAARHWAWLLASGIVMGIALGTKLTAALVIPAVITEIVVRHEENGRKIPWDKAAFASIKWSGFVGVTFIMIHFLWGTGSIQSSWRSHFSGHPVSGFGEPDDFRISLLVFWKHVECALLAIVALVLAAYRKCWRKLSFPIVLFGTDLLVHLVYHPWWTYYYLHFAIPIAWLSGYAVSVCLSELLTFSKQRPSFQSPFQRAVFLSLITATPLIFSEKRLQAEIGNLRARERINDSIVIAKMKENAARTHWAYVQFDNEIYPFHAKLLMPPELAMVSLKRFWSDQISTKEIVETCKHYRVEQVLLKRSMITEEWAGLLKSDFVPVYVNGDWVLYSINGSLD